MVNGVKVSMVYHFYCSNDNIGCSYNEINRRCLRHFHDIFDEVLFCICVDDTGDYKLLQRAVEWIWSCGFKDNVTIKVKQNTPFYDAQTFYDEVYKHLGDFDGVLFFGHNKGNTLSDTEPIRKWIVYSYYSVLDRIENHVSNLVDNALAYTYVPVIDESTKKVSRNKWLASGTYFLFNPSKLLEYSKINGVKIPDKLYDRFYAEQFLPSVVDICDNKIFREAIHFENWFNGYFESDFISMYTADHRDLISTFLPPERVEEYENFYKEMTNDL